MLTYQEVKNVLLTHSARRTRRGRAIKTPSTSFTLGGYSTIKSSVNRQVELCGNAVTSRGGSVRTPRTFKVEGRRDISIL